MFHICLKDSPHKNFGRDGIPFAHWVYSRLSAKSSLNSLYSSESVPRRPPRPLTNSIKQRGRPNRQIKNLQKQGENRVADDFKQLAPMLVECRSTQEATARWAMSTGSMQSGRPPIDSCSNQINRRINWCRFQQQLKTVTRDEREGWWAEEAGLMDALLGRDRTTFMKATHRSQLRRYLCGLHDGQTLLSLQDPKSPGGGKQTT